MTNSQRILLRLALLIATTAALGLAWWGWQVGDAGMLLLGTPLC